MQKVTIHDEIASLDAYWSQNVLAEANGQLFKVAKGIGTINWHKHDDQDELFIVYKGCMTIQLRTEKIELAEGDLFVVPKGVEHRVHAETEAAFLIVGSSVTSTRAGGKPDWSFGAQSQASE